MGLAATISAIPTRASSDDSKQRPNVIILFSDDQGSIDLNCYGAADLHTPNLDALAARGVRFSQFYAASSVCSPSRAALLTGRFPHRAGVPGNAESHPSKFGTGQGLAADQTTIAEMLKDAGYRTGHFGKWHLGAKPGPNGSGFDESIGFLGGCIDKWSHFNYGGDSWGIPPKRHDWYHNGQEVWETGRHSGDLIVRDVTRFIAEDPNTPFFIYAAFGTPHYPVQPYNKHMEYYKDLPEPRRAYAAVVSTLDEQIGRIIEHIDALGIRENTLIIFQADQGHSTEARTNYGGGNPGPYRGAKSSLFEGGLRIPAIISMPGRVPEGETRAQLCTGCDWFPTIAEICGVPLPENTIDGESLEAVLQFAEASAPHDTWHWQLRNQWAVRQGPWKLIMNPRDTSDGRSIQQLKGPFLFNIEADPSETTNLAERNPDIIKRLTGLHEEWALDVGAASGRKRKR